MNLLSNVAIVTSVKATVGSVGRIYGEKGNYVTIGEMGTADENKALNRAVVISAGIERDVVNNGQDGTGVSPTTLKLKATYVAMGWDFTDTWDIQETECYPYFKKQTAPPVILSDGVSGATVVSGKCVDGGTVTLEIDGVKQQKVSTNHEFSFSVSPLQAGHEVRLIAKTEGKEQSYYTTQVVSYLGKGTEADPYRVYTAADLACVYRKGYYKLMNDIDLTSYINQFSPEEGWESIGREGSETIHLDGDGHKITGLWCNSTRDNTGLFSCFANGYIKNLTVETANGKIVHGGNYTGILIGKLINGEIDNCSVSGTVAGQAPVGGMVGKLAWGKILRSQANVTIRALGTNSYVGGIAGEINGQVEQCLSTGSLTVSGTNSYVGGIAGGLIGQVDRCYSTGSLTALGTNSFVGGLVGTNSKTSTLTNRYSTSTLSSTYNASGLVAYNYGVIDKCYALGNIFTKNFGAGIVGYNDGEAAVVKNCVAMNNKIEVVYESQQVEQGGGYGQRIIGGIKNGAPAPEMNNYALKTMQVSVNDVPQRVYDDIMNGTGKTDDELKEEATYTALGWDFSEIWVIDGGYPYLRTDEAPGVTKGDLNGDGIIDILDIILIIDVMTGELTNAQKKAAADVNGDGDVDILDIISVIDLMITQGSAGSRMDKMSASMVASDFISASMQNGEVLVRLNNQNRYTAFQMVVNVPEGVSISDAKMNGERGNKHQLALRKLNEQQYLLMGFSADNSELTGNDGQLFSLTTEGLSGNDIVFSNVQFATTKAEAFRLAPVGVGNTTTDIQEISEQQARQAYDLQGRKVDGQLKKGLYIVNGKKINQK